MTAAEFQAKQLKPFIGATIVDICINPDDHFVCVVVKKKGKQTLFWIQSDPEGNGPGWVEVEEAATTGIT